jgi:hypothetical protein
MSDWFSRLRNWEQDEANGIGIRSDYHDEEDNNFAAGINECWNINGQNSPTGNMALGGFKLTGMGVGSATGDSINLGQSQKQSYTFASDFGSTDAYSIALSPAVTVYTDGLAVKFRTGTANTGAATLTINGVGAKDILKRYNAPLVTGDILANQIVFVVYDAGTDVFQLISAVDDIISLTQDSSPDGAADFVKTYDASASTYKKVLLQNFPYPATPFATQAEMETASSNAVCVTPGRLQYHPASSKAWAFGTSVGTADASYNLSSVTDGGTGDMTFNWDVDFSSTYYSTVAMPSFVSGVTPSLSCHLESGSIAAGSARIISMDTTNGGAHDANWVSCIAFGDQ